MDATQSQNIKGELDNLLSAYLVGWKNLVDCAEWLSSINWEEIEIDSKLAATLGELDLLCAEAREGLRPESDFEGKASDLVAADTRVTYSVARPMVYSSSTTVGVECPVLPFWNISPQEAPA